MQISGTNLTMIRGDTEVITISCMNDADEQILFVPGDTVYMTVKRHERDDAICFRKVITTFTLDGKAEIVINPEDTLNIISRPNYVYDIKWESEEHGVKTLIPNSKFNLLESITGNPDETV